MTSLTLGMLYGLMVVVFLAVDLLWLGVIARGFYQEQLGHLLRADVRWGAAVIFYLLFVVGVLVFAVLPGLERQSLARSILLGALFGLIAYATYDLTNLATLKGFPTRVVLVDMLWGTILSATVAASGYAIGRLLG